MHHLAASMALLLTRRSVGCLDGAKGGGTNVRFGSEAEVGSCPGLAVVSTS